MHYVNETYWLGHTLSISFPRRGSWKQGPQTRTTVDTLNYVVLFFCNDKSVLQASSTQGKTLHYLTSCLLSEDKFEAADWAANASFVLLAQRFASKAQTITTSEKDFGVKNLLLHGTKSPPGSKIESLKSCHATSRRKNQTSHQIRMKTGAAVCVQVFRLHLSFCIFQSSSNRLWSNLFPMTWVQKLVL